MTNGTGKLMTRILAASLVLLGPLGPAAEAQLVTSPSGLASPTSTITYFGACCGAVEGNGFTAQVGTAVGRDITLSYLGTDGLYYDYCGWGLANNGTWCRPSVGINQQGTVRFSFNDGLISGIGLSMNYADGNNCCGPVSISAFNSANVLLAQYILNVSAPITSNDAAFRGIQWSSPDIMFFELSGVGNPSPIFESMTFTNTSTVPEPGTIALLGTGLVGLYGAARRRRSRSEH